MAKEEVSVSPELSPNEARGVVPVKHAERVCNRETFEGQRRADFPRAGRLTGLLVVSGLGERRC
jgi:stress response protein YsnF